MKSVRVIVTGRVQGVWYRAWTCEQATSLGLRGWVRNRYDGCVEAVFCGEPEDIDRMIDACRQGPPLARVENLETTDCAPPEYPADGVAFVTLPTV